MTHEYTSRIADRLPLDERGVYFRAFENGSLRQFETAMARILRFESHPDVSKLKGDFTISNLDHVVEMLALIDDTDARFPRLAHDLNLTSARYKTIIHDIGEIYIDDLPAHGPLRETERAKRAKRLEAYCVQLILRNIPDASVRAAAIEQFLQYEKQDDPESRYVQLLDKIQGNQTGIRYIFNYRRKGFAAPDPWLSGHVQISLEKVSDRALKLREMVSDPARQDIDSIMSEHFHEYALGGFEIHAENVQEAYTRATQSHIVYIYDKAEK